MSTFTVHSRSTFRRWAQPLSIGRRALLAGHLILLILLIVGCGGGQPSPPSVETPVSSPPSAETPVSSPPSAETPEPGRVDVRVLFDLFQPTEVTIEAGSTVVWTNESTLTHTVTAGPRGNPSGLFNEVVEPGGEFSFTFEEPGTYEYHCSLHPGMDGTVVVE